MKMKIRLFLILIFWGIAGTVNKVYAEDINNFILYGSGINRIVWEEDGYLKLELFDPNSFINKNGNPIKREEYYSNRGSRCTVELHYENIIVIFTADVLGRHEERIEHIIWSLEIISTENGIYNDDVYIGMGKEIFLDKFKIENDEDFIEIANKYGRLHIYFENNKLKELKWF